MYLIFTENINEFSDIFELFSYFSSHFYSNKQWNKKRVLNIIKHKNKKLFLIGNAEFHNLKNRLETPRPLRKVTDSRSGARNTRRVLNILS